MASYTDIQDQGWVQRLPSAWRPYAVLARADRPIGAWLLFLPGLWSILLAQAAWPQTLWLIALFLVGAVVMRAVGCVVNDIWDRDIDRRVARTAGRPLAAGTLRLRQAVIFLAALLVIGLAVLLQLNGAAQALGVFSLLLVATYPLAKRVTWWPQLMLGLTFGWGAPEGWAAAGRGLEPAGVLLYAAVILWILGYDTIYAHQDREDDALVGVRSTARLFQDRTRPFLAVCYTGTVTVLAAAFWQGGLGWGAAALVVPAAMLGWQVWRVDIHDSALCLRLFKANQWVGLAVGAVIVLGRLW